MKNVPEDCIHRLQVSRIIYDCGINICRVVIWFVATLFFKCFWSSLRRVQENSKISEFMGAYEGRPLKDRGWGSHSGSVELISYYKGFNGAIWGSLGLTVVPRSFRLTTFRISTLSLGFFNVKPYIVAKTWIPLLSQALQSLLTTPNCIFPIPIKQSSSKC